MPKTIRVILLVLFAQAITCHAINVILLRDPGLLAPSAVAQLAGGFAQGQISFAFLALAVILHSQFRWRWIRGFAALYFLTLAVEWLGTRFGFPFGSYDFSDMLGIKWLGQVPALIPLAWFNIAVPSFVVASLSFRGRAGRIVAGAALMLAWDLCTDPLMGHQYAFWVWRDPGFYYGVPFSNFAGWFLVGLIAMILIDRLNWSHVDPKYSVPFLAHYGISLFMAFGLTLIFRMGLAVVACSSVVLALQISRRLDRDSMPFRWPSRVGNTHRFGRRL